MVLTKALYHYIQQKHIPIAAICQETGLNPKKIYPSLMPNAKRELKADELVSICIYLHLNPFDLYYFANDHTNSNN